MSAPPTEDRLVAGARTRKRGARRIRWDRVLGRALLDLGPKGIQIDTEVELFKTPPRLDHVLVWRAPAHRPVRAQILRGFWDYAPRITVGELKTITGPYVTGDLLRLDAKTQLYYADTCGYLGSLAALGMALLVPAPNAALTADLNLLGWTLESLGGGYRRLKGCHFTGFAIFLDEVAAAEGDDLIRCVSRHKIETDETADWLVSKGGIPERLAMTNVRGFAKRSVRLVKTTKALRKEVIAAAPTRERLAGIPVAERLAGISERDLERALPARVLRALRGSKGGGASKRRARRR